MILDRYQIEEAIKRFAERTAERQRNTRLIDQNRLLDVDSPERVAKFLRRRGFGINVQGGVSLTQPSAVMAGEVADLPPQFALERILGTNDLMGISFLEEGLRAARTIARIGVNMSGRGAAGYGTGFMVSPRLMLTNHHVLNSPAIARTSIAEFDHYRRADGTLVTGTVFGFDPNAFFFADRDLDYAVVALRGTAENGRSLAEFGHNLLDEEEGKAIAAQWANIIQHPGGEPKQVSLRENRIVDILPNFLHYVSDTAPGSSGSPVYNDRWEVVAVHHSGVPHRTADGRIMAVDGTAWRPEMGEHRIKWIANEGVRISRVIKHLRSQVLTDAHRAMFNDMLSPSSETRPVVVDGGRRTIPVADVRENGPTMAPDGTATWTLPLTISVNLGGKSSSAPPATPLSGSRPTPGAPDAPTPATNGDPGPGRSTNEVLAAARAAFANRSNVLGVRLGYVFKDGRITRDRALVVTVRRKKSPAELSEAGIEELPTTFGGLKVQVSDPTISEMIIAEKGFAAREALGLNVDALAAEITYRPPARPGLRPFRGRMKVTAHVSPDAGWSQLKGFLGATSRTLTVGMYDFGARHIAEAIADAGSKRGFRTMTLTLQPGQSVGSGTKADDLTDKEAVEELRAALGRKFKNAWVKIGLVNGWVASSYHIKVAVRDREAFWLSSGNWQSSNQPDADPLKKPWSRSWLSRYNREWHAIVEHPGLAADLERYLIHDFDNNVGVGAEEALILPDILVPDEMFMPTATERAAPFKYFEPLSETRVFEVQPLLTPDNYHEHVLELINDANEEVLIHNQTFNAPKPNHTKLQELLSAVLAKQRAGVDVKIVFRIFMKADARRNLEALQDFGFNMDSIKVQKNLHTKGIIVDRRRVLIGSQNFSEQGVSLNRDASLLFDDAKLAGYFADIFEHDWNGLASDSIDIVPSGAKLAPAGEEGAAGYTKISVEEYLETL
jgi:V8-like Glu-specific endopeptidase